MPVLRLTHRGVRQPCNFGNGGKDIHSPCGKLRGAEFIYSLWPLDNCRHSDASLVQAPLEISQAAGCRRVDLGQTSVVARKPNKRIFLDVHLSQTGPQGSYASVHGSQFGVMGSGVTLQLVELLQILFKGHPRAVGSPVPDYAEEGFVRLDLFIHELQSLLHDDFGRITLEVLEFALAAHYGI